MGRTVTGYDQVILGAGVLSDACILTLQYDAADSRTARASSVVLKYAKANDGGRNKYKGYAQKAGPVCFGYSGGEFSKSSTHTAGINARRRGLVQTGAPKFAEYNGCGSGSRQREK